MNKKVASEIIGIFGERIGQQTKAHDLAKLKERMETWFASVTITRRYLVPCAILTSEGRSFAIGPIRFFHISDLAPEDYDLPRGAGQDDPRLEPVTRIMRDQAAEWLCDVTVEGCEKNRSEEIADLAVDVAIGGLQLVIHPDHGRHMARITARTLPPYRGSFAVTEYGLETGVKNLQPGRARNSHRESIFGWQSARIEESYPQCFGGNVRNRRCRQNQPVVFCPLQGLRHPCRDRSFARTSRHLVDANR